MAKTGVGGGFIPTTNGWQEGWARPDEGVVGGRGQEKGPQAWAPDPPCPPPRAPPRGHEFAGPGPWHRALLS